MKLSGHHFEYSSISSLPWDLIIAHIDTKAFKQLFGEVSDTTTFNKKSKKRYISNTNYEDSPLSIPCEIISEQPIDRFEARKIESWLFRQSNYKQLYIAKNEDDETERIEGVIKRNYLNCKFTNPSKIEFATGLHGWSCNIECDSLMSWQDAITKTFTLDTTSGSSQSNQITVSVDTDISDYTYPDVTILMGTIGGDITVTNQTDSSTRITAFADLPVSCEFTMTGEINDVSSDKYDYFTSRNFVRLLPGDNTLSITGNVSIITMSWQNMRDL